MAASRLKKPCLRKSWPRPAHGEKRVRLLELLADTPGTTVIYCATVRAVEEVTGFLEAHEIVVAGYHRGAAGIVASFEAFAGDEAGMRRQVDRFKADYLVLCPSWLPAQKSAPITFARELSDGRTVPWLQPVDLRAVPLKVWRVLR